MIFNLLFVAGGLIAALSIFYLRYLLLFMRIPGKIEKAKAVMLKDERQGIEILNSILAVDRGNPEANWIMAHYHISKKWYVLALMYLLDIIRFGRYSEKITELDVRELLAETYEKSGTPDKALQQYAEIRKKHPFTAGQYKKIIRLYMATGDSAGAKKATEEAASAFIRDGEFCHLAGTIAFAEKEYAAAEAYMLDAERKGFLSPETDLIMGQVYFILQDFEKAIERFQKLPPDYFESKQIEGLLGQAFYRIKDYAKAEANLEMIASGMAKGDPHRSEALFFLGCAREMKGNYQKAIESWMEIPSYPPELYYAAKEKIEFYTQVAVTDGEKLFVNDTFAGFSLVCETLLTQMEYIVKKNVFQDEHTAEFLCTYRKDNYLFNLHYFVFTRQTAPVTEHFLKEKNFRRISEKARYLTVVAPWYSEGGHEYAKANEVQLYTLELFKKHGLFR
jgi:tetratricopeptide (TPR) repeat protein